MNKMYIIFDTIDSNYSFSTKYVTIGLVFFCLRYVEGREYTHTYVKREEKKKNERTITIIVLVLGAVL